MNRANLGLYYLSSRIKYIQTYWIFPFHRPSKLLEAPAFEFIIFILGLLHSLSYLALFFLTKNIAPNRNDLNDDFNLCIIYIEFIK